MDAILTVAIGQEFCRDLRLQVFFKSLRETDYKGDIIVFTHGMDEDIRNLLTAGYNVELVDIDHSIKGTNIWRERHQLYYEYLLNKSYERVLITDSKDVYFQANPFNNAPITTYHFTSGYQTYPFIMLGSEGGTNNDSTWNMEDQAECQKELRPEHKRNIKSQPIINAGFFMGTKREIQNLCVAIWSNTLRTQLKYSDQAVLNYLYSFMKDDPICTLHTPQKSNWVATGHGIRQGWFTQCDWKDGLLYHTGLNKAFTAIHQWERTTYQRDILAKMGLYTPKPREPNLPRTCPKSFEHARLSFREK